MEEIWDILDENGKRIGKTMKKGETIPSGFYHLGADIWMVNSKQDIELQDIVMQEDEVCDVKWATYEEIEELFETNQFIKNRWELKYYKSVIIR